MVEIESAATNHALSRSGGDVRRTTGNSEVIVVSRGISKVTIERVIGEQASFAACGAEKKKRSESDFHGARW